MTRELAVRAKIRPYVVAIALTALLSLLLIALKLIRVDQMQGDSALFLQLSDNIAKTGNPVSSIFASLWTYLQNGFMTMPPSVLATGSLAPPADPQANVLHLHTYFVAFPLGWLCAIVPAKVVLVCAFVLSFTSVLLLMYAMLVRRGVSAAAAGAFCLVAMTYPAWGQSVLLGQFYPDRLFVFAGFVLMVLLARPGAPRLALLAAAVFCASINERGALVGGAVMLLYTLLHWKNGEHRAFKIGLGIALVVFGAVMLKFVVKVDGEYAAYFPAGVAQYVQLLRNPKFVGATVTFFMVNLPLLALAAFRPRLALVALFAMLPNVFGSFGSKEKVGWTMHYQSFYMPVLLWAATIGFARAYRLATRRNAAILVYCGLAAAFVYLSVMNPYARPARFALANLADSFLPEFANEAMTYFGPAGSALDSREAALSAAIPEGSIVSTPESAMPELYHGRTLYFLPMGIDRADYVVLAVEKQSGAHVTYGGVLTRLRGQDERVNAVIVKRLQRDGYDLAHPAIVPGLGYAVVKRVRRLPVADAAVR